MLAEARSEATELQAGVRTPRVNGLTFAPVLLSQPATVRRGRIASVLTPTVERQNWSVRTSMRRYTRLSNGFSRKIENHMAAVAINYVAHNFIKSHRTLRVSPAMAAGVGTRLFDVMDLVNLLTESESKKAA